MRLRPRLRSHDLASLRFVLAGDICGRQSLAVDADLVHPAGIVLRLRGHRTSTGPGDNRVQSRSARLRAAAAPTRRRPRTPSALSASDQTLAVTNDQRPTGNALFAASVSQASSLACGSRNAGPGPAPGRCSNRAWRRDSHCWSACQAGPRVRSSAARQSATRRRCPHRHRHCPPRTPARRAGLPPPRARHAA